MLIHIFTLMYPMMRDAILGFPKQFLFDPAIVNVSKQKKYTNYVVLGMGGSHLAADLALIADPMLPLTVWSDYGLPPTVTKDMLVIASSYSGNTEETIDGLLSAIKKHIPVAVIAVGGKLLGIAKEKKLPYIELPDTGIQPRSALGFSLRALFKLLDHKRGLAESAMLAMLRPDTFETAGKDLAKQLKHRVPVIYSSRQNLGIAYNWKIKFNETGKIPAFYNILPELNHNEMTGFDVADSSKSLSEKFFFLFLEDKGDHPRIQKRMSILAKLYKDRGFSVLSLPLTGNATLEKIFSSLFLADWTAVAVAEDYGLESEQVPMVEEFKRLMVS